MAGRSGLSRTIFRLLSYTAKNMCRCSYIPSRYNFMPSRSEWGRILARAIRVFYRPSDRPSVARVNQSKTVEVRIMQLSPQSSPMTLVSSW